MEESLKLKPSRTKWLATGALFVALSVGFALLYWYSPRESASDESLLVIGPLIVLFLAGAILSFLMLSPERNFLLIDSTGFTVRTLFKVRKYRWEEIDEFQPLALKSAQFVVFTLSREGKIRFTESGWRRLNRTVSGGDDNLPDTYGMSAQALAELMNKWKLKIGR